MPWSKKTTGYSKNFISNWRRNASFFQRWRYSPDLLQGEKRFQANLWPVDAHLQAANQGYFAIQLMPMRRLFFEKAILETPEAGKEIKPTFKTSDLSGLFLSMVNLESASLVHIRWQTAEAFVLVPGSKISRRQAVFISKNVTEEKFCCVKLHPKPSGSQMRFDDLSRRY